MYMYYYDYIYTDNSYIYIYDHYIPKVAFDGKVGNNFT